MALRPTFGSELRRLREHNGLTLTELSRLVNYSCSWLSRIETGSNPPNTELALRCDHALNAGGSLTDLASGSRRRRSCQPSGLPPATALLIGRDADAERLGATLLAPAAQAQVAGAPRACVIHGMPGVGKTALAVNVAHQIAAAFPEGVLFVDLRGYDPGGRSMSLLEACDRLLAQLGVESGGPAAHPQDRLALYRDRLQGRRTLVILDNVRDSAQVRPLLAAGPDCRVLVTSRDQLTALDEVERVHLDVLTRGCSARMFETAASVDNATRRLSGEVARWCGDLPLALRIVAARCRAGDEAFVSEVVGGLADEHQRLGELDDGERSVATAFATSYDRLGRGERRLLTLVAVAGSGVDVHGATALTGLGSRESGRLLARLADANLLIRMGTGGFGMHLLLRDYVLMRSHTHA